MLEFEEKAHAYTNIDKSDDFQWISVTRLVGLFKEKFDAPATALRCSKGKNPKYKGKSVEEILDSWTKENNRSTSLGSWYHNKRETHSLSFKLLTRDGIEIPIISPIIVDGIKISPSQKLEPGVYPEHFVYLRSASVCGQADRIEVLKNLVDVFDYKTNKEIKTRGYEFYDGTRKMMLGPVKHLEDCELNHYALQLSIYMFIILRHNLHLDPGTIRIDHVSFETEGLDEWGYPITAYDAAGDPIVKKIVPYVLPYLKKEVVAMFKWLSVNKEKVLKDGH